MSVSALIEIKFSDDEPLCMLEVVRDGNLVEITKTITAALSKADNDGDRHRLNWNFIASQVAASIISKHPKAAIIAPIYYKQVKKGRHHNNEIIVHPIEKDYQNKDVNILDAVYIQESYYGKHAFGGLASEANNKAKAFKKTLEMAS